MTTDREKRSGEDTRLRERGREGVSETTALLYADRKNHQNSLEHIHVIIRKWKENAKNGPEGGRSGVITVPRRGIDRYNNELDENSNPVYFAAREVYILMRFGSQYIIYLVTTVIALQNKPPNSFYRTHLSTSIRHTIPQHIIISKKQFSFARIWAIYEIYEYANL